MRWLLALCLVGAPGAAWAVDCGTGPEADCDGDGFTLAEGDCDDTKLRVNPANTEVCNDRLDNDCNGLFDEGCDQSTRLGSLRGGGACTGAEPESAALAGLLVLPWWRRRRRRCC